MRPDQLRQQARALLDQARRAAHPDQGLVDVLRALEYEALAEQAERDEIPDAHVIEHKTRTSRHRDSA
jgi:hypothetical protein